MHYRLRGVAFRDDEIDLGSILLWVGKPSETGLDVVNIPVGPLDSASVNKMVADLTERHIEQTKELSELVGPEDGEECSCSLLCVRFVGSRSIARFDCLCAIFRRPTKGSQVRRCCADAVFCGG